MDTNVTADTVSGDAVPTTVTAPVTTTVATPIVVDPVEAKVKELLAKERDAILQEAARLGQSGKDKRLNALQQELQAEKARRQALENALNAIPNLGPDADPNVVNNLRLQQTQAQLGVYRQQEVQRQQIEREAEAKQLVLEETREEITELGVNPDDPRIPYDLSQPDAKAFRKKVMAAVRQIKDEDAKKSLPDLVRQAVEEHAAKARKESGVDLHESAGVAGTDSEKAFKAAQAAFNADPNKETRKTLEDARAKRKK